MIRGALLALLLPAAAASGEAAALSADACAEDGTCSLAMLQRAAQRRGACECLTWAETYASGKVKCGKGLEFYDFFQSPAFPVTQEQVEREYGNLWCPGFYEKLDSNACVNLQMGRNTSSWCYVSAACSADGVEPVPHNQAVRWKRCGAEDNSLRSKTPEELRDMCDRLGLDLTLVAKFAYHSEHEFGWKDAQGFWGLGSMGTRPQGDKVPVNYEELARSYKEQSQREYFVIYDGDEYFDSAIVRGDTVYVVQYNATTPKILRCVRGC